MQNQKLHPKHGGSLEITGTVSLKHIKTNVRPISFVDEDNIS